MFTGIIQCTAEIIDIKEYQSFRNHVIRLPQLMLHNLKIGSSVSYNGCCLTVVNIKEDLVSFDLIRETLNITNLGNIKISDKVNIERALKLNDEIGGHLMSGHITTTAKICDIINLCNTYEVWFKLKDLEQMKYIFHKGFIGIDGISLTVGKIVHKKKFCVFFIPETLNRTCIKDKTLGSIVNIEIDQYARVIAEITEGILKNIKIL